MNLKRWEFALIYWSFSASATNALRCHEPPANHICSIQHILCKKME